MATSEYHGIQQFKVRLSYNLVGIVTCTFNDHLSYRVVESFEVVTSLYTQQLSLNESQNITASSLTVVAELVIICLLALAI